MNKALYNEYFLDSFYHDGDRYYILPECKVAVPSVTTVIYEGQEFPDTPFMTKARNRGTAVHNACEHYLRTEKELPGAMPSDMEAFHKIKRKLKLSLKEVNLIESCLFSKNILTAGRADCVGIWNDRRSIIDFKTSRKPKKDIYLENYFLQLATYAMLAQHTYKDMSPPTHGVLVIANDEDIEAQVFIEDVAAPKWIDKVLEVFVEKRQL